MASLSESDLRFLVETVATRRRDIDRVIQLIRDKEDLLEPMLEDPKLSQRILSEQEQMIRISPRFLFSVLLRRLRQDLQKEAYLLEIDSKGKRFPIFVAPAVTQMLSEKDIRSYLAEMLASFARTNSGVIFWKERGRWHKRRFSDIDLDDMIELARIIDPEIRPRFYRRVADIALFLSGIFPDHTVTGFARRNIEGSPKRTLSDYELEGTRFYHLAACHTAERLEWLPVFERLAANFSLARRALNALSDRYLRTHRQLFRFPDFESV